MTYIERVKRKARLEIAPDVEDVLLYIHSISEAARMQEPIDFPSTLALLLSRAVTPDVGCGRIRNSTEKTAYHALLALYQAAEDRVKFQPTERQVEAIVLCLKPEIRRAWIIFENVPSVRPGKTESKAI